MADLLQTASLTPWQGNLNARSIQAYVTVNGTPIPNAVIHFEVKNNNYFSADTFEAQLSLDKMPAAFGAAFWSDSQAEIGLGIVVGNQANQLILGYADTIDLDIVGGTIGVTGRDLTSYFIDTKTEEKFGNMTSSQIAATLAGRHGLSTNITATSTLAGRYFEIDHARMNENRSEWQLLTYLAQEEGFDVYVTGNTLNFQPSAAAGVSGLVVQYSPASAGRTQSGNFLDLQMRRSMTLARDIIVKVVSWNAKQAVAFTKIAHATNSSKSQSTGGTAQTFTFRKPGLTGDQAQALANAKLKELTLHERVVNVTIPGEVTLQPRQLVTLTGTGTGFDQDYYIDEITRSVSEMEGFRSNIRMKNHSPESTVSA